MIVAENDVAVVQDRICYFTHKQTSQ
jgi:hypothetical protein